MSHTRQYIFIKDGHNSRHTHTHTVKQENPSWSLRSFRHPLNLQTLREPKSSALKSSRPQTNSTASNLIILHILPEASKLRKSQATRIIQLWWKATAFSRVTVEEGAVPLWLRAEFSLICWGGGPGPPPGAWFFLANNLPRAQGCLHSRWEKAWLSGTIS